MKSACILPEDRRPQKKGGPALLSIPLLVLAFFLCALVWEYLLFLSIRIFPLPPDLADMIPIGGRTLFYGVTAFGFSRLISRERASRQDAELLYEKELARRQTLQRHLPGPFWITDHRGRFLQANTAFYTATGLDENDIIGRFPSDLFPPEIADRLSRIDKTVRQDERPLSRDLEIALRDGLHIWNCHFFPLPFASINSERQLPVDKPGVAAIALDVRAARETAARADISSRRLDVLTAHNPIGILIAAADETIRHINPAAWDISGRDDKKRPDSVTDVCRIWQFFRPDGRAWSEEDFPLIRSLRLGEICREEEALLRRDDRDTRRIRLSAVPVLGKNGIPDAAVLFIDDDTDLIMARESARREQGRYRGLIESAGEGFIYLNENGKVKDVNQALCDMLKYSREEMIGKPILAFIYGEDHNSFLSQMAIRTSEKHRLYQIRLNHRSGRERYVRISATSIMKDGRLEGSFGIITDITDRHQARLALRQSAERYRSLFNGAHDAILIFSDHRITECNPAAEALFELPAASIIGQSLVSLSPPQQPGGADSLERFRDYFQRAAEGVPQVFEWHFLDGNGRRRPAEISLNRPGDNSDRLLQAIIRDAGERKKLQELMIQSEKMSSVAGLAAGMAHELNNPLGIILQMSQNMGRRLSGDLKKNRIEAEALELDMDRLQAYLSLRGIPEYLEAIREAGLRSSEIVRNMLNFSRQSESRWAPCHMDKLTDHVLELANGEYDLKKKYDFRNIRIIKDMVPLPTIMCTETEIIQVLLNLIKNAAQAMAGQTDPEPELIIRGRSNDGNVRMELEDNGTGMDEATRRRSFEPFFTTKDPGDGTGLGLSVSYYIISTNHNGRMYIESSPGKGTTVGFVLPGLQTREESP